MNRVILFDSTRFAIRAEKLLKEAGFKIKVIPTPRKYSSNCGVSIAFSQEDEEAILSLLNEKAVPLVGPYDLD